MATVILATLFLGGCDKEIKEERLEVPNDFFTYSQDQYPIYTVDEMGNLYTTGIERGEESSDFNRYLHCRNLEGELVKELSLDFTSSSVRHMQVKEDKLYLILPTMVGDKEVTTLYSYDIKTEEESILQSFIDLSGVKQMEILGDEIYLIGYDSKQLDLEYAINQEAEDYVYQGETILYYSLIDQMAYQLEVDFPISMSTTHKDTLMIYAYDEFIGYYFAEYNPQSNKLIKKETYNLRNNLNFSIHNKANDYLYINNMSEVIASSLGNSKSMAQLAKNASSSSSSSVISVKGQVFYCNREGFVERFSLDQVKKENKEIHYISDEFQFNAPFGCGYNMTRRELEPDAFALKVLARDKDYDICVMETNSDISANIQKNGVFYPLNELEGIKEYLDACYPYVKEAATKSDGTIWMLPISVQIPGLIIKEDSCKQFNLPLNKKMSFKEYLDHSNQLSTEKLSKISLSSYVVFRSFFNQYFSTHQDVDTEVFRSHIKDFQRSYQIQGLDHNNREIVESIRRGLEKDFHYIETQEAEDYFFYANLLQKDSDYLAYSLPNLSPTGNNVGSCTFIAVNPNSKRLKETLAYLEDFIEYTMGQEQSPLYFHTRQGDKTSLIESVEKLYKEGEISFQMDQDLYWNQFFDYLKGSITLEEYLEETKRKLSIYENE